MKYLPSTLLIGALTFALQAQTPAPKTNPPASTPAPKPAGDPFVKNPGDAPAEDAQKEDESPNVLVVFEAYSLNKTDAATLLETEANSAARYRRVVDMTKAGHARLQTLQAIVTKSGQRAVTEAIDEVRYATEFAEPVGGKSVSTPTAWETRNAGDSFELEPVAGPDGHYCDLNLVPARVTLAKFQDAAGSLEDPATSVPIFNNQRITTSVTTDEGVPSYLGTFTPPPVQGADNNAGPGEVWLAFVHSSIQKTPVPADKSPMKADMPAAVNFEYACYSLDRAAAREILVPVPAIGAAWDKVHALAAEKKAQLEFITSLRTKSGQRAVVEEIQEVRFATEYNPAARATSQESSKTVDSNGETKSTTTSTRTAANAERIPGFATAFETRHAGISVEVEPVIRPDQLTVDLNHVVQNVRYLGLLKVPGVGAQYQPQPLFQSSKATTSETVVSGKYTLIGTFNSPGTDGVNEHVDSGRTCLLFVNATVVAP